MGKTGRWGPVRALRWHPSVGMLPPPPRIHTTYELCIGIRLLPRTYMDRPRFARRLACGVGINDGRSGGPSPRLRVYGIPTWDWSPTWDVTPSPTVLTPLLCAMPSGATLPAHLPFEPPVVLSRRSSGSHSPSSSSASRGQRQRHRHRRCFSHGLPVFARAMPPRAPFHPSYARPPAPSIPRPIPGIMLTIFPTPLHRISSLLFSTNLPALPHSFPPLYA